MTLLLQQQHHCHLLQDATQTALQLPGRMTRRRFTCTESEPIQTLVLKQLSMIPQRCAGVGGCNAAREYSADRIAAGLLHSVDVS